MPGPNLARVCILASENKNSEWCRGKGKRDRWRRRKKQRREQERILEGRRRRRRSSSSEARHRRVHRADRPRNLFGTRQRPEENLAGTAFDPGNSCPSVLLLIKKDSDTATVPTNKVRRLATSSKEPTRPESPKELDHSSHRNDSEETTELWSSSELFASKVNACFFRTLISPELINIYNN